jgi:hypothetical protein
MLLTPNYYCMLFFWATLLVAEVAALHLRQINHAQSRRALIESSASKAAVSAAAVAATSAAMLLVGTRADAANVDFDKFAADYDQLDGGALAEGLGLEQLRRSMTASAAGHVLEIAVGTGLNLPNYKRAKVTQLDCIDLSSAMLQQVRSTISMQDPNKSVVVASVCYYIISCLMPACERALDRPL